jgi:hypothetical protein
MIKMPRAFQVSECVRRLTRRETETTLLARPSATVKLPYGGTFHGGDRAVVAMCAADLALAAFTGAALSLIPAESAQERIATGVLDEMLQENFAEVLNVLARIYVVPESARMTLLETIFPPRAVPATLEGAAPGAAVLRADYRIDIDGYGTGHLALWGLA